MFKGFVCAMSVGLAASAVADFPSVSNVVLSHGGGRDMLITYDLAGAPAVVTVDIQTNVTGTAEGSQYASIGKEHLLFFSGDANRRVEVGSRTIRWAGRRAWRDHEIAYDGLRAVLKVWPLNDTPDYMVVDLVATSNVHYYASAEEVPGGIADGRYRTTSMLMKRIPAKTWGVWTMGSPSFEKNRNAVREAPHAVELTRDFYMAVYQATQGQYYYMTGSHGGSYASLYNPETPDYHPVSGISYNALRGTSDGANWPNADEAVARGVDGTSIIGALRTLTGVDFDLPTEAQWEFACRGGCQMMLYNGTYFTGTPSAQSDVVPEASAVGWYSANSGNPVGNWGAKDYTMPVGRKPANPFGLHDMLGNLYDWCLDWYADAVVSDAPAQDPTGPSTGSYRVRRSCSYTHVGSAMRCAFREYKEPTSTDARNGFRLVCFGGLD